MRDEEAVRRHLAPCRLHDHAWTDYGLSVALPKPVVAGEVPTLHARFRVCVRCGTECQVQVTLSAPCGPAPEPAVAGTFAETLHFCACGCIWPAGHRFCTCTEGHGVGQATGPAAASGPPEAHPTTATVRCEDHPFCVLPAADPRHKGHGHWPRWPDEGQQCPTRALPATCRGGVSCVFWTPAWLSLPLPEVCGHVPVLASYACKRRHAPDDRAPIHADSYVYWCGTGSYPTADEARARYYEVEHRK